MNPTVILNDAIGNPGNLAEIRFLRILWQPPQWRSWPLSIGFWSR